MTGTTMAWIKVTDPKRHALYLRTDQLVRIRPAIEGTGDLASAKSIVDLAGGMQAVLETQEEIIDRIREAEKKDEDKAAGA
jgi:hypothetical protein